MKTIKKYFISLVLVIFLSSCSQPYIKEGIRAEVITIDDKGQTIFVRGLSENSPLGDQSYVNCSQAQVKIEDGEKVKKASFDQIKEKDILTLEVGPIMESYPTQTQASKILIEGK